MKQSKKHHYIPRFYLKGFTNERNQFFVYDKKKDEIRKSNPDNSFFEKYRNTGFVKDEKSDLPERMLAHFDDRTAGILEQIRKSEFKEDVLSPENLYIIRFFIATTFWRIPINDQKREEIINDFTFEDLGFGIFDKQTGERSPDTEEMLKDIDLFRKIYTSLLPLASFLEPYKKQSYRSWKLIHRTNSSHVTGDNPIILRNSYKDFSSLQEELIIPLSSKKVLLCTNSYVPKAFPPAFNLKMDLLILHQSERFVCSSSEEYLQMLVEAPYRLSKDKGWESKMVKDLFGYFY